jgi:hypothetical protein
VKLLWDRKDYVMCGSRNDNGDCMVQDRYLEVERDEEGFRYLNVPPM